MGQLRALIVDDSSAMRKSIALALQRIPELTCAEAENGLEALKRVRVERFDVILTDINMPLMDGLKLIGQVRGPGTLNRETPLVVITTEASLADRQRALALGANVYLTKPLRAHTVIEAVKDLLKLP